MSAAWIVYALLVGTLLALAAHSLEGVARRLRIPARFTWIAALAVLAGLSASAPLRTERPQQRRAVGVELPAGVAPRGLPVITWQARWAQGFITARAAVNGAASRLARELPKSLVATLAPLWIMGSVIVVLLMLGTHVVMLRRRAVWPRAHLHGAEVRITSNVGPAVVGFHDPDIVVPNWLLARSDDEQRLAVAHEREHLAAHDHVMLAGGWLLVAMMPWHPAVWWMLSRLRLAIELDCDARVLRAGVGARSYGQMLIDIADHVSGQRAMALALADHTSHLERRLLAMKNSRRRFGRARATLLGVTGFAALLVACESKLPTSAEVEQADVAKLEEKVVAGKLIEAKNTAYAIDGRAVSAEEAHALHATEIAAVNVVKSGRGNKILIATLKNPKSGTVVSDKVVELVPVKVTEGVRFKTTLDAQRVQPIFLIDGVRSTEADFVKMKLTPDRIESVEVLKGDAAKLRFPEPDAANGVILIKTKQ